MCVVQEEVKLNQDTCHIKELSIQPPFMPYFQYLCLTGFNKTQDLKREVSSKENYRDFFEFFASSELLRSHFPPTLGIIFDSKEETEDLFLQKREYIIAALIQMFEQHIIHVREIQAFARQMLNYKKEAESNPGNALEKARQFILEHLNKMKELPICDTLRNALSLLPKIDADDCTLKFMDVAIKASEMMNKLINARTERQSFSKF